MKRLMHHLNRTAIWAALLGSVIIVVDYAAEAYIADKGLSMAIQQAVTYFATAVGLSINTRKGLRPG